MFGKTTRTELSPAERSAPARSGGGETVIGAGTSIKGEVTFDDALRIEGKFEGRFSGSGRLHTGPASEIMGDATVGQAMIEGLFQGNISAAERIELAPTAKVTGDIRAPRVVIAEGAMLQGTCVIGPQLEAGEAPAPAGKTEAA